MSEFEYKVSVIVPIYNVDQYLRSCLDSLIAQTIDHDQMEVLLIDDGSSDNSLAICKEYAEVFSCFKVFSQENAGVSTARNLGIINALGKYIMFLDSDDMLSPETVQAVTDYFDTVYDEVDLVTYPERKMENGKILPTHFRYNILKKTGIYDLNKSIYATISRINVAVKNTKTQFNENLHFAEDQNFLFEIIRKKMKIGFVEKGLYTYIIRSDSAIGTSGYAFYFWESVITNYYEKLFTQYEKNVPKYLQAMFLYDSNWKIRKDQFFPYHYEEEKLIEAKERLSSLLKSTDIDVLFDHPALDYYHKFFLLKLRKTPITVLCSSKGAQMLCNGKVLHNDEAFTIVVTQLRAYNNTLKVLGHLKSPLFAFIEKPTLYAYVNGEKVSLELFKSTASRYKSKIETGLFWGFYLDLGLEKDLDIKFMVTLDGFCYETSFYFMPFTPINIELGFLEFTTSTGIVSVKDNVLGFRLAGQEERIRLNKKKNDTVRKIDPVIYSFRAEKRDTPGTKIWLYYDCKGVEKDNGYYQFIHDIKISDGVERYYISNNNEGVDLFEDKSRIVKFGSNRHKSLFINADKIITAYIEKNNVYPFPNDKMLLIMDILQYETIYLQHGILHASIPWKYTPEALQIDKVVASSYFEVENFIKKYNFRDMDIYRSGMPRYAHIDRRVKPRKRILFAPSWRNYLIMPQVNNFWKPEKEKFLKSDYYVSINSFLNSPKLEQILSGNNLYLDFKIHPIFTCYLELFDNINEHVCIVDSSVKDEEYAAFITDFSSFVFDFVYLERPIMYFVPDYSQFKAGMNQYRELDLPFDKAFGKLVTDVEGAVNELGRIIENGLIPDPVYKERMDKFFLPMKDCCEDLYNQLKE